MPIDLYMSLKNVTQLENVRFVLGFLNVLTENCLHDI